MVNGVIDVLVDINLVRCEKIRGWGGVLIG